MSETLVKENVKFNLNNLVFENIQQSEWNNFFARKRKKSEYNKSGKKVYEYISYLINENKLEIEELNLFLERQLTFGKNRNTLICNIGKVDLSFEYIKSKVENKFGIKVESKYFNNLALERANNIGLLSIVTDEYENVKRIKVIFIKELNVVRRYKNTLGILEQQNVITNRYFPIEVDLEKGIIIAKARPTDYVEGKSNIFLKEYIREVIDLLGVQTYIISDTYKKALYNICRDLLENTIKEKSKYHLNELELDIENFSKKVEEVFVGIGLDIKKLKDSLSNRNKSIFDIKTQVSNSIENMILSNMLFKASMNKEGLDGIVSYIKFSDRKEVNAVIKTKKRKQSLIDSQTYLAMRRILMDCEMVEKVRVRWYKDKEEIDLYYDASELNFLEIHFYSNLFEEELNYAWEKLESCKS